MKKIGLFTICLLFISSMVFAQLRPSETSHWTAYSS